MASVKINELAKVTRTGPRSTGSQLPRIILCSKGSALVAPVDLGPASPLATPRKEQKLNP